MLRAMGRGALVTESLTEIITGRFDLSVGGREGLKGRSEEHIARVMSANSLQSCKAGMASITDLFR